MNIAMFTNTYLPHVGGVAQSVDRFSTTMRRRGHDVFVIAPTYDGAIKDQSHIHRVTALQNFDGSDFSVALPIDFDLANDIDSFQPQVLHAHHPFLLGNTAARYASSRSLPLVFTYHTMYEHYTHYVPVELDAFKDYVVQMAKGFANLCDAVIAPSESTAEVLKQRGVVRPIYVAPTGVDLDEYANGDGTRARKAFDIPDDARLIGTVGRLAPEKNLPFLANATARALQTHPDAWFLVVGDGPSRKPMQKIFADADVSDRVVFAGVLKNHKLCDAYHALDVFVFASKTETQGMVLVEALSTGCPVVALDAPGAREVLDDGRNGRLVHDSSPAALADAIGELLTCDDEEAKALRRQAAESAKPFSTDQCVDRVLDVYRDVLSAETREKSQDIDEWQSILSSLKREWDIWTNRIKSMGKAILAQEQKSSSRSSSTRNR